MENKERIKTIDLILDNPANQLTTTSRSLLITMRLSIECDIDDDSDEVIEMENLEEGVETQWGTITMRNAMIDTDGTNLEDGLVVSLDGEVIGELVGYTSPSFDTVQELEDFVNHHCDI